MSDDTCEGARLNKDDVVLKTTGLEKALGGPVTTDDVSIEVERGTITGMTGPNGTGKFTPFGLISDFYGNDVSHITIDGEGVTDLKPHERVRKGLTQTFQTSRRLERMSVHEAMFVGPGPQRGESVFSPFFSGSGATEEGRASVEQTHELLERFKIGRLIDQPSTNLSGGQMKLVELVRAFTTSPDVLLLDESVAGISPTLANGIKQFIRKLSEEGQTLFIIEHDMPITMDLADPIIVLDQGKVLMKGSPDGVRPDDHVIEAYLRRAGPWPNMPSTLAVSTAATARCRCSAT